MIIKEEVAERRFKVREFWLWWGTVVIPSLFVVEAMIHYPLLLRSGVLPADKDSIGIPIMLTAMSAPFNALVLLIYVLPAVWRYDGSAIIGCWDRRHRWRLLFSCFLYGLPAVLVFADMIYGLVARPPLEATILLVEVPLIVWLLMLRAAMAQPRNHSVEP